MNKYLNNGSDYFIRKQKFESRANLELMCEDSGITKNIKTLTSFELKRRLFDLRGFDFDASRSNSIYGNSVTVQPPSQTVHLCIKYK
mgnify:CR=1 FL=1